MDAEGLAILDESWDIKSANNRFFTFIGGNNFQSVLKLIRQEQSEKFIQMFEALKENSISSGVFDMLNFDGNYYPVYLKVKYKDESRKYYELKLWDVIKSEESFAELNADERRIRNLLAIRKDINFEYLPKTDNFRIFMFSGSNEVTLYNDTLEKWKSDAINNGYIEQDSITQFKKFCSELRTSYSNVQSEYYFRSSLFSNGIKMQNIRCYCKRNTEEIKFENVDKEVFKKEYVLGIIRAYSQKSEQNESILFSEISRDFLTGVLNKMSIKKYCEDKISDKPPFKMCMAIIDVDNFKSVNDNLGHMNGDKVLIKVADIISGYVGEYGTVGRFGGDEFFVFFENIKNLLELRGILRAIRSSVEIEFEGLLKDVKITLSIGVSTYPDNGSTYEELFKIADKALYIAKEKGKNRYIIYNRELHGDFTAGQDNKVALGRGAQDYTKFMVHIISRILNSEDNINCILRDIKNKFLVDRVNIYYGEDFKLTYSSDQNFKKGFSAQCFKNPEFIQKFDRSNEFVVNHIDILGVLFKDIHKFYDGENVFSVIHCLIGNAEEVRGMITFEKIGSVQKWAVEEIKDFAIITSVISGIM